jgi:hypothetical protein
MGVDLSPEARAELRRYVDGDLSNAELADWLVGAEYDPALPQDERDSLARIRLVVIEVDEGARDPSETLDAVAEVLASATDDGQVVAMRTGSTTIWAQHPALGATPARLQRVGI